MEVVAFRLYRVWPGRRVSPECDEGRGNDDDDANAIGRTAWAFFWRGRDVRAVVIPS